MIFNAQLTVSFTIVGIWPASRETAPLSVKGPPQIRAVWLGGEQILPIAIHGFLLTQLKADFSPLYSLRQGVQCALVVEVDGSVDEVVRRDYQSDAKETSVLARSVLGKNKVRYFT